MCAKQKTETKESYRSDDMVVPEGLTEALSMRSVETDGRTTYENLLELVVSDGNLERALDKVVSNRGSPGVDGMTVLKLREIFPEMRDSLRESIVSGKYRPTPVRRKGIPKPDGGERELGIPTVRDRLVMQAIYQVLMPIYDPTFSDCSFGFRPGRGAHEAIARVMELYDEGYTTVVSIDLSKYFDTIPQDNLMNIIRETIRDKPLVELIKRFLKSGTVMEDGLVVVNDVGTPQGSPLSPLLANIYLDRFDKEMERRGLNVVRYADDANIYVRTPRAGERVMGTSSEYLEKILKLKVNREKSKVGSPTELKFLGFRLEVDPLGTTHVVPHEKSIKRFKDRIREITRRHRGDSIETIAREQKTFARGWFNYFGIGSFKGMFEELDGWTRRRMRAILLVQWKTPKNRQKNFRRFGDGLNKGKRWNILRRISYRKHIWRASGDISLNSTITNSKLQAHSGMYYMADDWEKVQARFPRSPLRDRMVGSVGGRQTSLLDFMQ